MSHSNTNKPETKQDTTPADNQDRVIDASDKSRNDERDDRIGKEPDTARLRSERESTMKQDPE